MWRIESYVPIQARSSTWFYNEHLAIKDGSKERWCKIGIRRQQRRSRRRVHAIVRCSQQANEGGTSNNLGHMVGTHHHAWHCCCYWEWDCNWQGSYWGTQIFFSHPLLLLILISILVAQILCGCWGFNCANVSRNCATNYDICKMTTKVQIGNDHFLGSYFAP